MKSLFTAYLLLFASTSFAQLYQLDHETINKRIKDEVATSSQELLGELIGDSLITAFSEKRVEIFAKVEGFIYLTKDSVEQVLGPENPNYFKTSKAEFLTETEIKNDTITIGDFVFVRTSDKNKATRMKELKEINEKHLRQQQKKKSDIKAIWEFEQKRIFYDTIVKGEVITASYKFRNNSNEDLRLTRVQNECHCTNLTWPEYPVKPGMTDSIVIEFDTQNINIKDTKKLIIVECDLDSSSVFLWIDGVIIKETKMLSLATNQVEGLPKEYEIINQWEDSYTWIKVNDKTGLLDADKNIIIEPFVDGEIIVLSDIIQVRHNNKVGIYDLKGKEIFPAIYNKLRFHSDFIQYTIEDSLGNERQGYLDENWNKIFDKDYCSVKSFYDVIAISEDCELSVLIDKKTFKPFSSDTFSFLMHAGNEKLRASKDDINFGLINKQGKTIIPFKYQELSTVYYNSAHSDSILIAKKNGKYGVIDLNNKNLVDFKHDYIYHSETVFACRKDKKWGLVDINNQLVIPHEYEKIILEGASADRFVVMQAGLYGVINKKNRKIVDLNFENVQINSFGDFVAKHDGKWALFNSEGTQLTDFIFKYASWNKKELGVTLDKKRFSLDINLRCLSRCPSDQLLIKYGLKSK